MHFSWMVNLFLYRWEFAQVFQELKNWFCFKHLSLPYLSCSKLSLRRFGSIFFLLPPQLANSNSSLSTFFPPGCQCGEVAVLAVRTQALPTSDAFLSVHIWLLWNLPALPPHLLSCSHTHWRLSGEQLPKLTGETYTLRLWKNARQELKSMVQEWIFLITQSHQAVSTFVFSLKKKKTNWLETGYNVKKKRIFFFYL